MMSYPFGNRSSDKSMKNYLYGSHPNDRILVKIICNKLVEKTTHLQKNYREKKIDNLN